MKIESVMTLDMVEALIKSRTSPFDFSSAKDCQSALNRLKKEYLRCIGVRNLSEIRAEPKSIDAVMARIERTPPISVKERRQRANMSTRLHKLARVVAQSPAFSESWHALEGHLHEIQAKDQLPTQALIPIRKTLKTTALEDHLDPGDMTSEWIAGRMHGATAKRRNSLRDAARLIDRLYDRLPAGLRPITPFGDLSDRAGGKRRSRPLPPVLADELTQYLDNRVMGSSAEGLRPGHQLSLKDGIKSGTSTTIYWQAMKWFVDSLRVSGSLASEDLPQSLIDAARLDWMAKVGFQALQDHDAHQKREASVLPWNPIQPKTIQSRMVALRRIFTDIHPDFNAQTVPKVLADGRSGLMNAEEVVGCISDWVSGDPMTERHRRFCLALLSDTGRQRLLLNMHTICWRDAQEKWANWEHLERGERRPVIDLCVLAAILAVVVHYPFRARTVTELTLGGTAPDVILQPRKNTIDFAVFKDRLKIPKDFDAMLEDSPDSQPRKILEWFIAGPREMILNDPSLLSESHRHPERLFGGFNVARYGGVLAQWTETQGMRMTTHEFRHAIATMLVNLCGARLDDVALMLGNTPETVARHYVMIDGVRRRAEALGRLVEHRRNLEKTEHPRRPKR